MNYSARIGWIYRLYTCSTRIEHACYMYMIGVVKQLPFYRHMFWPHLHAELMVQWALKGSAAATYMDGLSTNIIIDLGRLLMKTEFLNIA